MDKFILRIFQSEVGMQCHFVAAAADDLANVDPQDLVAGFSLTDPYWTPIQTILVSAANLSKMFWGKDAKTAARRQPLRRSLRVTKRSPLYSRTLRNQFEHFDEKVEAWYRSTRPRSYLGRNIGPENAWGGSRGTLFGNFNPATGRVTFLGHSLLLDRLVQEAARIRPLAEAELLKPLS